MPPAGANLQFVPFLIHIYYLYLSAYELFMWRELQIRASREARNLEIII